MIIIKKRKGLYCRCDRCNVQTSPIYKTRAEVAEHIRVNDWKTIFCKCQGDISDREDICPWCMAKYKKCDKELRERGIMV